ncbi:MAG: glycosyltransferase family 4 protein [Mucilaginibacter sp.]
MDTPRKKLFIVVNVDWFFLSHRLPIALAAMEKGYDVTILCADTGRKSDIIKSGLKHIHLPLSRSGMNVFAELRLIYLLSKIYIREKPDVIHHVTLKPVIYGSIAYRFYNSGVVVNAISGLGYNFTHDRKSFKQTIIDHLIKYSLKNDSFQFIFQNLDDIKLLQERTIKVKSNQINLIKGSGINLDQFAYSEECIRSTQTVVLAARLLYDKGIIEFIKAAKLLKAEFVNTVKFVIAGNIDKDNPATISLAEIKKNTDGKYIEWIGFEADMKQLLINSSIVVLPSYREGLPKSLIEAAAIGRPIVTTDAPGCKDCVIEGYNGYKVPVRDHVILADKIRKLLVSPELRKEMGRNSRLFAENNFDIDEVVHKTLDIYETKEMRLELQLADALNI